MAIIKFVESTESTSSTAMRPNLLFSILGVMMVALCAKAELWPDPPDSSSPPTPISDSKNSTLTFSQFKARYNKKYSSLA